MLIMLYLLLEIKSFLHKIAINSLLCPYSVLFINLYKNDFFVLFYIIIMSLPNFDNQSKTSAVKNLGAFHISVILAFQRPAKIVHI